MTKVFDPEDCFYCLTVHEDSIPWCQLKLKECKKKCKNFSDVLELKKEDEKRREERRG